MEGDINDALIDTTISVSSMGNECFICYEDMNDADKVLTLPCCKKELHKECLEKWHENIEGECKCPHCMSVLYTKITDGDEEQIQLINMNTINQGRSDEQNRCSRCIIIYILMFICYCITSSLFAYNNSYNR